MDERLAAHLELAALSDEDFVDRAFRLLLRRPPDDEARGHALAALAGHGLSRAGLVAELAESEEFRRLRALDDGVGRGAAARANGERPHELVSTAEFDERPIELAWTLGRYRGEARVLDLGYAFAEPVWLAALLNLGARELVGVDLIERDVPGMTTVQADARQLPFDARAFDVVFCISTLEHVGGDNTRYGSAAEQDPEAPLAALRELRRVTTRGGKIFLTVPCGSTPADWFLRQPADAWRTWFRKADLYVYDEEVYVQEGGDWRQGPRDGEGVLCVELHPGRRRHEFVRLLRRRRQQPVLLATAIRT
jgi:O-antigen chain-terminating methyltransferase